MNCLLVIKTFPLGNEVLKIKSYRFHYDNLDEVVKCPYS